MAAAPKPAGEAILRLPVDQIDIPADRLRALKPEQAAAIGEAIKADRQYDAISVARLPGKSRYVLVDGLHRLEGCRTVGLAEIDARVVSADRDSRRRQEVLSAWARADHDAFDKAAQVAAMVELAKANGETVDEREDASIPGILGWDEVTCDALKITRAWMFRHLKIHRFYSPSQKKTLREKGLADDLKPLVTLAALPPEQFAVAWAYIEETAEPTIAEALARVTPAALEPAWEKRKHKVLTAAAKWQPHQISELINDLRALHSQITGKGAA